MPLHGFPLNAQQLATPNLSDSVDYR